MRHTTHAQHLQMPQRLSAWGDSLSLYMRYVGISIRSQMQYRSSFYMLAVANLVGTGIEFVGIWALFARFGSLRGWRLPEIALFYGITNISFALAEGFGRGFDAFSVMVKAGDFDRLLLRPRSTALQIAGQELQMMRIGRLLQGLFVLLWAVQHLSILWSASRILLLLLTILGGMCLFYGLFIVEATLAFWTVESLEIMNTVTYGGTETAQYPLSIYRPWFRRFFTFVVPLACINYIPMAGILRPHASATVPLLLSWLAPLGGVVFLCLALTGWNFGVRHYCSTGS